MEYTNLFVPGRVSIIGELSDIVVDYKKENSTITPGEVIAGGIEKGIYATATLSKDFIFEFNNETFTIKNMNLTQLKKTAKSNCFYSYVSSVAYYMKKNFKTSGISIKVLHMTLPIQKGLSSSASVCVLVTKAFNKLYNLNLEYNDIMEIAYQAERFALSMCGRLDQICAKGLGVSHIIFHEDKLEVNKINVSKELNFVIADLNGFKDTKKILSTLHSCFPFPKTPEEESVKYTLCEGNHHLVNEAIKAIENGDSKYLGEILIQAQTNLDNSGGRICKELEGPLLHKVMSDDTIKKHSYGSKGTGSNGDGSIVVLAKDKKSQTKLIQYLKEKYQMNSFEFNLKKTHKISSAIINTFNESYDENKILSLLDKLDLMNFNNITIVLTENEKQKFDKLLNKQYSISDFEKLSNEEKEHQIKLCRIYERIRFVISDTFDIKNNTTNISNPTIYIPNYNSTNIENILEKYDINQSNKNEKDLTKIFIIDK